MIKKILILVCLLAGLSSCSLLPPLGSANTQLENTLEPLIYKLQTTTGLLKNLLNILPTGIVANLINTLDTITTALTKLIGSLLNIIGSILDFLLGTQLLGITKDLSKHTADLTQFLGQLNALEELNAVAGTVPELTGQLTSVTADILNLKGQLEALQSTLTSSLNDAVKNLVNNLNGLNGQLDSLVGKLESVTVLLTELIADITNTASALLSEAEPLVNVLPDDLSGLPSLSSGLALLTPQIEQLASGEGLTDLIGVADMVAKLIDLEDKLIVIEGLLNTVPSTPEIVDFVLQVNAYVSAVNQINL